MENKKLQIGIEEIHKITMTALEKQQIFESILNSTILSSKQSVRSPWFVYSFISRIQKNHLAYYVFIPLIIIFTSGGIAIASGESLPSSILYPIKVGVIEPVIGALTFSPKARAKYEINLATERLIEAETLVSQGKLDKSIEKKLDGLLDNHTVALSKALNKASQTESIDQVDEIITSFHAGMNAHARILDIISRQDKNKQENQDLDVQISKTARINAEGIKSVKKNKENKNKEENNSDKYKQKKNSIESLINRTAINLNNTNSEINKSNVRQAIINNTNKTLDEAKQFLNEANIHQEEGNSEDAYSKLLDSESSVKEAGIFLETGLKLEEGND